jgi:uncharacterized membrane protein YhaH (DUF805 family)
LRRILAYLSRIFSLDLRLPENWRDVFVPAWLYFINDARIAFKRQQNHYGVFLIVFGGLLALLLSLASEDPNQSLAIFVTGFVVYETISSLYSSATISYQNNKRRQTFFYYFKTRVLSNIALGLFVLMLDLRFANSVPHLTSILFILYVFMLGLRDIAISVYIALAHPRQYEGQTALARLAALATWKLGYTIVGVIAGAVAAILVNS